MSVTIDRLRFEHHRDGLGIHETQPRVSWRFAGTVVDWEQTAYEMQISHVDKATEAYRVESGSSLFAPWPSAPLLTAEPVRVRVRAHGRPGQPSTPWSAWARVEAGLLDQSDWAGARPIVADRATEVDGPKRPVYFRRAFAVGGRVQSARLYITALGMYEAQINGERVGDRVLAPGWQSYQHRHVYDTYDVTDAVQTGDNAIGVIVGEGWYVGRLGYGGGRRNVYGDTLGVQALLVVTQMDGTVHKVPTDVTWQASLGPLLSSEIYDGEHYDSRLEAGMQGWASSPGGGQQQPFDSSAWLAVKTPLPALGESTRLQANDGPPVRKTEEYAPRRVFSSKSGKTVVDFGQNLVGWLRLTVSGPAGTEIVLHHAEVLENGELALRPLRASAACDHVVLHGHGVQTWEPHFTFHGFRYAQVDGWPADAPPLESSVVAIVVHSDMEPIGDFHCSDPLLNRLHANVRWSMKGNFVSLPTDCPQRDERLGWTGDAHAFGPTANFLYDTAGFWRGWFRDLGSDTEALDGVVPCFVPVVKLDDNEMPPTAVWSDVAVGGVWDLYQVCGDKAMLAEQFVHARSWLDRGVRRGPNRLWDRSTFQFGDWLDPVAPPEDPAAAATDKFLVADAYLTYMTDLAARIARAIGDDKEASRYGADYTALRAEFAKTWLGADGDLADPKNRTQTSYALVLHFGLLDDAARPTAGAHLRALVAESGYRVATGFAGTPVLPLALDEVGATADAYRLVVVQRGLPSWLYQVALDATTSWERWDSMLPDGRVNPGEMTSFNHYAFGAVAAWLHSTVGGLAVVEPGWRVFAVHPVPGAGVVSAHTTLRSPYGFIRVRWWVEQHGSGAADDTENADIAWRNGFHLVVSVPPNSRAHIRLPGQDRTVEVGSGEHTFHDAAYKGE